MMKETWSKTLLHLNDLPRAPLSASRLADIMQEITTAHDRLSNLGPAVSFFGSSRLAQDEQDCETARQSAKLLSREGYMIMSGGGPGIMEAVNQGGQEGGSLSVGLNIWLPNHEQTPNAYQDISLVFRHFVSRKMIFMEFASAYVVMPGGIGTLDELLDCLTLMQTGKRRRIPVILVNSDFWDGLLDWLHNTLIERGTIAQEDLSMIQVLGCPEEIRDVVVDFYRQG